MAVDPYMGILMKRKEFTWTFMVISNWKKPFDLHDLYQNIQCYKG